MNEIFFREADEAVKKLSRWQKFYIRVLRVALYLGDERRDGWSGALPFYLFWCEFCKDYGKDYPHKNDPQLHCPRCDAYFKLNIL